MTNPMSKPNGENEEIARELYERIEDMTSAPIPVDCKNIIQEALDSKDLVHKVEVDEQAKSTAEYINSLQAKITSLEGEVHGLRLKLAGLYGYADIQGMEFVKHIKAHLSKDEEVICKICGKTVEQIALEAIPDE